MLYHIVMEQEIRLISWIAFAHFEIIVGGYGSVRRAICGWHHYALANQNARTVIAIKKESYSKVISLSYFVVCNHYGFTRFNMLSGVLLDGVTKLVQTMRIYNSFQLLHRIWHVFLRRQRHPLTLLCKFNDYPIPCRICIYIFIFAYLADKKMQR